MASRAAGLCSSGVGAAHRADEIRRMVIGDVLQGVGHARNHDHLRESTGHELRNSAWPQRRTVPQIYQVAGRAWIANRYTTPDRQNHSYASESSAARVDGPVGCVLVVRAARRRGGRCRCTNAGSSIPLKIGSVAARCGVLEVRREPAAIRRPHHRSVRRGDTGAQSPRRLRAPVSAGGRPGQAAADCTRATRARSHASIAITTSCSSISAAPASPSRCSATTRKTGGDTR